MLPSHVLSKCCNSYLPSIAQPLSLMLTLCSLNYPQALDQHLLHLKHWRQLAQRALEVHQSALTTSDSDNESSSDSDSPLSACSTPSTAYTRVLRPRLHNKAALSQLCGRPQVRTLHNVSIPLPLSYEGSISSSNSDGHESPTTEAEANSPTSPEELSPVSRPDNGLPQQPKGRATNKVTARPSPQTRGGVTSTNDAGLPAEESPTVQILKILLTSPIREQWPGMRWDENTN